MNENQICGGCARFTLYYVFWRGRLRALTDGYCVYGYMRNRIKRLNMPACKHFVERETTKEAEKKSRNTEFRETIAKIGKTLDEIFLILSAEEAEP